MLVYVPAMIRGAPFPGPSLDPSDPAKNNDQVRDLQELVDVERQLLELHVRRAMLQSRINTRADPLSTKLPVEVVSYIFQLYVQSHAEEWPRPKAPGVDYKAISVGVPLRLGSICRGWREVAWATPGLWSTLIVNLTCKKKSMEPQLVAEWLARTGKLPLLVKIGCPDKEDEYEASQTHRLEPLDHRCDACIVRRGREIIHILNRHAAQWKCLDLGGLPDIVMAELDDSHCTEEDAPSLLEYLAAGDRCGTPDWHPSDPPILHRSIRIHAPRHLSVVSSRTEDLFNIDWEAKRLSTLHMELVMPYICYTYIFEAAKHNYPLRELSLSQIFTQDNMPLNWTPQGRARLSFLVSLRIDQKNTKAETLTAFLDNMELPALQSLTMKPKNPWDQPHSQIFSVTTITSLLVRSRCSLQSLTLIDPEATINELIQLLEGIPTLRHLTLDLGVGGSDCSLLLSQMGKSSPTAAFLPNLETFCVAADPPESWDLLLDLLSRHIVDTVVPSKIVGVDQCEESFQQQKRLRAIFMVPFDKHESEDKPETSYILDPAVLVKVLSLWHDHSIYCFIRYIEDDEPPHDLMLQTHSHYSSSRWANTAYQQILSMPYLELSKWGL